MLDTSPACTLLTSTDGWDYPPPAPLTVQRITLEMKDLRNNFDRFRDVTEIWL